MERRPRISLSFSSEDHLELLVEASSAISPENPVSRGSSLSVDVSQLPGISSSQQEDKKIDVKCIDSFKSQTNRARTLSFVEYNPETEETRVFSPKALQESTFRFPSNTQKQYSDEDCEVVSYKTFHFGEDSFNTTYTTFSLVDPKDLKPSGKVEAWIRPTTYTFYNIFETEKKNVFVTKYRMSP